MRAKNLFTLKRRLFDKTLRRKKKQYARGLLLQIEECCMNNPHDFWNQIKKLGPNKRTEIPWKLEIEGEIITDCKKIIEIWGQSFENIYKIQSADFNEDFKKSILSEPVIPQTELDQALLNREITRTEIVQALGKSKNGKAVGCDLIPNELLRNNGSSGNHESPL